jgi:dTDP-4-dehydrorhamnose reductase/dTDP-4-dehydrorhamnose 3,5-epimerase
MSENFPAQEKKELKVEETNIPGLLVVHLPVHGDDRGWFKENWQREKMVALGLPDFNPVQNNISYNATKGATRGIHTEPWDKFVSVAKGKIFAAWVDMRTGSEPNVFTIEMDASTAVFVPRGVGNSYQALEDDTVYTYLVNDHWTPNGKYTAMNLADKTANINWPIPLEQAEISEKDKNNPSYENAELVEPKKVLITGANGQLGLALQKYFPNAECVDLDNFNIADEQAYHSRHWKDYELIINAAAYTQVDLAETPEGRITSWQANAHAVKLLAKTALENNITLVHVSSDYVFDGTQVPHQEDEPFSPLSVYGESKAAGDVAASMAPKHYIMRTSWVVGRGKNFVKTMKEIAEKGVEPAVVNDQLGRLTFTDTLASAIKHLIENNAKFGTYNITNDGPVASWADIAKIVYEKTGHNPDSVTGVSTEEYYSGKKNIAPRPLLSEMDLSKIKSTGFTPISWEEELNNYLQELKEQF